MDAEVKFQAWLAQVNGMLRHHNLVADVDGAGLPLRTWCVSGISTIQAASRILKAAGRARKARRGRK